MPTNQTSRSSLIVTGNADKVGRALAQVVKMEAGAQTLLGQAWLAAPDRLVTCGHVVEQFVRSPNNLFVHFPGSGNRYPVSQVRLHPSFVRQPDGLVKFDLALLVVQLSYPECEAEPLPFSYEQSLKTNQAITAIRYPVHLGQFSAALQPLTQDGRFLGLLRKHDTFHLLHDLPLSPGDSGAPVCDDKLVVAVHCGDTATIPGLNLPTTSIRLAIWVDALRDLGLQQTRNTFNVSSLRPVLAFCAALAITAVLAFGATVYTYIQPQTNKWAIAPAALKPVKIDFNRPLHEYDYGQEVVATVTPESDCNLFLYDVEKDGAVYLLYPNFSSALDPHVKAGQQVSIRTVGTNTKVLATPDESNWYLVAVDRTNADLSAKLSTKLFTLGPDPTKQPQLSDFEDNEHAKMRINASGLQKRLAEVMAASSGAVMEHKLSGPSSKPKS